jgi:hypothetical protein
MRYAIPAYLTAIALNLKRVVEVPAGWNSKEEVMATT